MSVFRIPLRLCRRGPTGAPLKRTLQLELLEMRCVLSGSFSYVPLPQGSSGLGTLLLLTDGSILAHDIGILVHFAPADWTSPIVVALPAPSQIPIRDTPVSETGVGDDVGVGVGMPPTGVGVDVAPGP